MQNTPTTHWPEQTITNESIGNAQTPGILNFELGVTQADQESYPRHPDYERLINRSFYGFWQV